MADVLDWSAFNAKYAFPSPSQMDYNRVQQLYEAGEIDGIIARIARGKYPDVRFPEYRAELTARGVPLAGYGVFSPYNTVAEQVAAFWSAAQGHPLNFVGPILCAGDVEIPHPNYTQAAYAASLKAYLEGINANTIYSSKYYWELLVGNAADGWHGAYRKWVANYTSGEPLLPNGWPTYTLHQYSETGNGAYYGVGSTHVDLNRWNPVIVPPPDPEPIPPEPGECEPRPGTIIQNAWLRTATVVTSTYPPTGTRIVVLTAGTPVEILKDLPPEGGYDWLLLHVPSLGLYGVTAWHLVEETP